MPEEADLDIDFDAELAVVQGTAAGLEPPGTAEVSVNGEVITSDRTVALKGRRFRIADKIGLMPLLKFSAFADLDVQDPRALGAMYAMLRDCIHPGTPACGSCEQCDAGTAYACKAFDPGDWHAFEEHAMVTKADADDLMDVISKTIEIVSGRPTPPPARSSPGRRTTAGGSTGRSSGKRARGSRR